MNDNFATKFATRDTNHESLRTSSQTMSPTFPVHCNGLNSIRATQTGLWLVTDFVATISPRRCGLCLRLWWLVSTTFTETSWRWSCGGSRRNGIWAYQTTQTHTHTLTHTHTHTHTLQVTGASYPRCYNIGRSTLQVCTSPVWWFYVRCPCQWLYLCLICTIARLTPTPCQPPWVHQIPTCVILYLI